MDELRWSDATEVAGLIAAGSVSVAEVVEASVARVEALNPDLNAVITPMFEQARSTAAAAADVEGPFGGVPFLVKDLMCEVAGVPFHEGMRYLNRKGYVPSEDQELYRRFVAAGLLALGKTNTSELGLVPTTEPVLYGPTHNPWDVSRSPGGSSGGSAAAVASGMVPIAHANDGGGSIRGPAAYCGLVGLKPTRGRVPLGPLYGDVFGGLVCEFVVTRSVRDTAAALDAVAGPMSGDPYAAPQPTGRYSEVVGERPNRALKIGVWTGVPGGRTVVAPAVSEAVDQVARVLGELGHSISEGHPPVLDRPDAIGVVQRLFCVAAHWGLRRWERICGEQARPDELEPMTRVMIESARGMSGADVFDLLENAQLIGRATAAWHDDGFDVLLMPATPDVAPPLGILQACDDDDVRRATKEMLPLVSLLAWCNITGQPSISLPLAISSEGLPIGVQLVAPHGREDRLLSVAAQLERAMPWDSRHPAI
jgi:amidase